MACIIFTYIFKTVKNSSANKYHFSPYGICQIIHSSNYLQYDTSLQLCGTATGFATVNIYRLGSGFLWYFSFLYIYSLCRQVRIFIWWCF